MKPSPPKSKDELFVNICFDNRSLIGNQLLAEAHDLLNRNTKIQKGFPDESYKNDKLIFETTRKLYNELSDATRDVKEYPKWQALHDSMYNDPATKQPYQGFTYSKYRYRVWEGIRQPFLKQCNKLFPEKPVQKHTRTQRINI